MLEGLLWHPLKARATFREDGSLQWLVLERHRLTGAHRVADPEFAQIRAQDFASTGVSADE